jgi:hypothetical protein
MAARSLVPPLEMILRYFDFNEENALASWEHKIFQGRVAYWVDFEEDSGFVHSKSKGSASAIFYRLKFDVTRYPHLSWKWRVGKFPDKTKVDDSKRRDDFAARVYVVFIGRFFSNFKCVEYVWDEHLPEGTILDSPYAKQIKQLVIQSGPGSPQCAAKSVRPPSASLASGGTNPAGILADSLEEWVSESRNVLEDYQKLFGRKPKNKVAAIAIMTDSEGTAGEAEAFFDDIKIGKNKR